MPKNPDAISRKIAAKARDEWIKKAAMLRVAAQQQSECSLIMHGNRAHVVGDLNDSQGEPVTVAGRVRELNALADEAERKARQWDVTASAGETKAERDVRMWGSSANAKAMRGEQPDVIDPLTGERFDS